MSRFSVTQDVHGGDTIVAKVLLDNLDTENEAWEAGHTWLMENDRPHEALDIRKDGIVVGAVSWEP